MLRCILVVNQVMTQIFSLAYICVMLIHFWDSWDTSSLSEMTFNCTLVIAGLILAKALT